MKSIQERVVNGLLVNVAAELAERVANNVGVDITAKPRAKPHDKTSPALSMDKPAPGIKGKKVAILAGDGVDAAQVSELKATLMARGALAEVIAKYAGSIKGSDGSAIPVDRVAVNAPSVIYDAVFIPSGSAPAVGKLGMAVHFVAEAYMHGKAIAAAGDDGAAVLKKALSPATAATLKLGVATGSDTAALIKDFTHAMLKRHFDRDVESIQA